ncbi:MFS transporter [Shewanella algae]|uniref:MFS transporter n=1 Tax=Shewanella algae TaxID=38313 RepID=UPI000A659E21|nr:MFS transporter [Shewanella algae]
MLTSKFLLYQLIMRYYLICAFALVLLYPLGIDLYLVGLPEIARTLNADEAQLHNAFSCYLTGMALAMLLGGHLADRLGRKPVALCGALIFVLSSIWAATTLSITAFLFARAGQGIGAGAAYLVTFAILRDVLDDQRRAKVLSMINGITCIVPVLAPVLGHLVLLYFPWPALFVLMALLAAAALFLCLGLQESLPAKTAGELIAGESLLCVTFVSRLLISCLAVTAILTFVNTSPMLLMEQLGLDSGGYASAMGGLALVSMVMAFISPWLIDSIGQQRMLQLSQLAFALAATVLLLAASLAAELWLYLRRLFCGVRGHYEPGSGTLCSALGSGKFHIGDLPDKLVWSLHCDKCLVWIDGEHHVDTELADRRFGQHHTAVFYLARSN